MGIIINGCEIVCAVWEWIHEWKWSEEHFTINGSFDDISTLGNFAFFPGLAITMHSFYYADTTNRSTN